MVTDIIEHLVEAQNSSATQNITQTLSNILDVSLLPVSMATGCCFALTRF